MIRLKPELLELGDHSFEFRLKALKHKLQVAIELEHSTIPPYLYALYSIKTEQNLEIAHLIKSVVKQEMLHMSLDCNVLNAIGGHPKIDSPHFIPDYPGHLPGTVEDSLIVPLAALSKQLVLDVFMVIEEPEQTVDGVDPPPDGITIGQFYDHIKIEISALSRMGNIFTGAHEKQLVTGFPELQDKGVTDEASALAAIDMIIEQGEGSHISPLDPEHELAHYYKYAEVYYGRKLIANPAPHVPVPPWVFEGHRIEFDACGIYPVISNPNSKSYMANPRLADLNLTFNRAYSDMLRKLHKVFNGHPDQLALALLSMQGLRQQAQLMMALEVVPGQTAGPTFDYIPA
ncbi:ferritin-like domain-containing protein [Undibacterium sp. TJN19]|uniref:ferritin-like domain-containing protein n=1 Tax=Undibacterium sp. TJN19 TaxID=3413055 RepID=UPI003BEF561A